MTCSARLPVYAFLIAFVVPDGTIWGLNRQGLFLYGLYIVSSLAALLLAWGLHKALPTPDRRREMAEEWPSYRVPRMKLVAQNMFRQGAVFVRSAGQVIVVLSVVLWTLGFLGPGSLAERQAMAPTKRLETSVLGAVGDAIEPVVTPWLRRTPWHCGFVFVRRPRGVCGHSPNPLSLSRWLHPQGQ